MDTLITQVWQVQMAQLTQVLAVAVDQEMQVEQVAQG